MANMLRIPVEELLKLAKDADHYYSPNRPEQKPNGGIRITYRLKSRLKKIQQRIVQQIFHDVDYPFYLQGSIKDERYPRDYINNASLHAGQSIIIREDISSFFPSIKSPIVLRMWQLFFHFPKDVAMVLTQLTTYGEILPQGAPTSSYISNLVFWDKEPQLEYQLRQKGFRYSRFVDDVTISSDKFVSKENQKFVTTKVYRMLRSINVKPNRSKRKVQTRANKMTVHKLNVNSGKPTLSKPNRAKIRAAVKECEEVAEVDRSSEEYKHLYQRVNGRVAVMSRLHDGEAKKYRERLQKIKPVSQKAGCPISSIETLISNRKN